LVNNIAEVVASNSLINLFVEMLL